MIVYFRFQMLSFLFLALDLNILFTILSGLTLSDVLDERCILFYYSVG